MFWIISSLLFVLAIVFVVLPLLRHSKRVVVGERERDAANLRIYRERLAELQAELDEGLIDQPQYDALEAELSRTVLSDVSADALNPADRKKKPGKPLSWLGPSRLIPLIMVLAMLPASIYLYGIWGASNDLRVAELFERSRQAQDDPQALQDLIFELGAVIENDRSNGWAWYFMARNLVSLGQFNEAALAFRNAADNIEHPQDQAVILGQYAQAQYVAEGQQMTERVQEIITRAQRLNPSEPSVLQLLGADAFVNGDYQSALTYWQQLLGSTVQGSEDAQFLRAMIAEAQAQLMQQEGGEVDTAGTPQLEISLALSPEIDVPAETRVFVSAQDTSRPGPPLAAKLMTVADLPAIVSLSDTDAVGPFNLSSAEEVIVVATVAVGGTADVQSGDYQVRSEPVKLNTSADEPATDADSSGAEPVRLQMLISDAVP